MEGCINHRTYLSLTTTSIILNGIFVFVCWFDVVLRKMEKNMPNLEASLYITEDFLPSWPKFLILTTEIMFLPCLLCALFLNIC